MNITMICDASYCPKYKVAGYGFWIASQRGKFGGAGHMTQEIENNNTAEMMAICNTIWEGIKKGIIFKGDTLLIQSDCLSAMDKMKGIQKTNTDQESSVLKYYEKTVSRNELNVKFRHVRGHTTRVEARFVANRMCDKRAKSAMRTARRSKIVQLAKAELEGILND